MFIFVHFKPDCMVSIYQTLKIFSFKIIRVYAWLLVNIEKKEYARISVPLFYI